MENNLQRQLTEANMDDAYLDMEANSYSDRDNHDLQNRKRSVSKFYCSSGNDESKDEEPKLIIRKCK